MTNDKSFCVDANQFRHGASVIVSVPLRKAKSRFFALFFWNLGVAYFFFFTFSQKYEFKSLFCVCTFVEIPSNHTRLVVSLYTKTMVSFFFQRRSCEIISDLEDLLH